MRLQRILGVFLRYYYSLVKGPHQLTDLFYWPIVDILLWGLTSVWIQTQNPGHNLSLVLLTGLIFWQITWRGSIDISFNLLQELWHRNLINLFSTPLKLREWLCGSILISICKLILTVAVGGAFVYLTYGLNVFSIGWIFVPFAISLLLFGWSISFLAAVFIVYWGHRVEMVAWMAAFLFAPFSAIFYPVAILPGWAQTIAWCLPSTYIFESIRSFLYTGQFPLNYLWISLGLNGAFLATFYTCFYVAFQKSRAKGLARLE